MIKRISLPIDYDDYAPIYASSRSAHPWVVRPLAEIAAQLTDGAAVLGIGCGTGNYIHTLAKLRRELSYFGFDLSEAMLREARSRGGRVGFASGDAGKKFPYSDECFSLAFAEVHPSLTAGRVRLMVQNTGVGPARVRAAAVTVNDQRQDSWDDVMRSILEEPGTVDAYHSLINGRILPSGSPQERSLRSRWMTAMRPQHWCQRSGIVVRLLSRGRFIRIERSVTMFSLSSVRELSSSPAMDGWAVS